MSAPELSTNFMKTARKQAHRFFSDGKTDPDDSDANFTIRMMIRTRYGRRTRQLQLGTIIRIGDEYRICVQPLCDSVRLTPGTTVRFPFLRLKVITEHLGSADFVIREPSTGAFVRLEVEGTPSDISTHEFVASDLGTVQARPDDDLFIFEEAVTRAPFHWSADLKSEFGQAVAIALGHQFARPGVNEPEILRLSRRT
jgi:hypothetical protein